MPRPESEVYDHGQKIVVITSCLRKKRKPLCYDDTFIHAVEGYGFDDVVLYSKFFRGKARQIIGMPGLASEKF